MEQPRRTRSRAPSDAINPVAHRNLRKVCQSYCSICVGKVQINTLEAAILELHISIVWPPQGILLHFLQRYAAPAPEFRHAHPCPVRERAQE